MQQNASRLCKKVLNLNSFLYILDTTILILYRKLYINIVSIVINTIIIVLNIEARQYNIKINLVISIPKFVIIASFIYACAGLIRTGH